MNFGPVKSGDVAGGRCDSQNEAFGRKPGLLHPSLKIRQLPPALLGVVGKGAVIDSEPRVHIQFGIETSQGDTGRQIGLAKWRSQGSTHLPEHSTVNEIHGACQCNRCCLLTMCPQPKWLAWYFVEH